MAFHTAPRAFDGYARLMQGSRTFRNEVCARLLLVPHRFDPIMSSKEVGCPVLLQVCQHDNLVAPESYKRSAENLGSKATVKFYPIGHFDIYEGEHFERAIGDQLAFVKRVFEGIDASHA